MACFKRKRTNGNGRSVADKTYAIEVRDHSDVLRGFSAFTDRTASQELERNLKRLVALRMSGIEPDADLARFLDVCPVAIREHLAGWGIIDFHHSTNGRLLNVMVDAWAMHLQAKECSGSHLRQAVSRVKRIFKECRLSYWTDVQADKVEIWLSDQRRNYNMGNRTSNSHLASAKAFCTWMQKSGHARSNPLFRLSNVNERADKRRERRALMEDEINRLLGAAESGAVVNGMNGHDRKLLYQTALETGLRWGELYSLTRASFDFDGEPATVTIQAKYSKNRKENTLPLRSELAAAL